MMHAAVEPVLRALQLAVGVALIALLMTDPPAQAAPIQATAVGPNLGVAMAGTAAYTDEIPSAWSASSMAPGDTVSGAVMLRVTDASAGAQGLSLAVIGARPPGPIERALQVTSATLGEQSLLSAWSTSCAAGATLTVADLMTCHAVAPITLGAEGTTFSMTVALAREAGNSVQGGTTGGLRFEFQLETIPSTGVAPPSGGPGSGQPTGGSSLSAVPRPPSTGMGPVPSGGPDHRLELAAALALLWLLLSILAGLHGRHRQRGRRT